MSAHNLDYLSLPKLQHNLDELLICLSDKDLMHRKLGVGEGIENKDLNLFLYSYEFFNKRFCGTELDNCIISKINALIHKYK